MTPGTSPYDVLVMGTGSIGLRHAGVFEALTGRAPYVLPVRPERAASAEVACFRPLTSLDEARRARPALAVVATDTGRHLADLRSAIDLGAHVLLEKPAASTHDGIAEAVELARGRGLRVFVGCCMRFHDAIVTFRRLLPRIGAVHDVRIECQSYLPSWRPTRDYRRSYSARADEGGVLRDLVHEIDYAFWLFGRPRTVFAVLSKGERLGIESEERAALLWRAGEATVSLSLDYVSRVPRRFMRAQGERGAIEVDVLSQRVTLEALGEEPVRLQCEQGRDDMMLDQARAFVGAALAGEPSAIATLEEGGFAVALCDAARESSVNRAEARIAWEEAS